MTLDEQEFLISITNNKLLFSFMVNAFQCPKKSLFTLRLWRYSVTQKKKNSDHPFLIENNNKKGLQANIEHVKNDCNSELCLHFYKVVVTC